MYIGATYAEKLARTCVHQSSLLGVREHCSNHVCSALMRSSGGAIEEQDDGRRSSWCCRWQTRRAGVVGFVVEGGRRRLDHAVR